MNGSQKQHLNGLSDRAHEKELTHKLSRLYDKFQIWKDNEITPMEFERNS
jgi:hypothetical protein